MTQAKVNLEFSEQELRQLLRSINTVVHEHSSRAGRSSKPATIAFENQVAEIYGRLASKIQTGLEELKG